MIIAKITVAHREKKDPVSTSTEPVSGTAV